MKLIVGLGNPGKKYENTRHNIGFRILDSICDDWKLMKKCSSLVCKKENVLYAKPQTYMNLSGMAINSLADYYKIYDSKNILLIYDDKDILFEKIKFKEKGSSGGHKGALSTIEYLKTEDFPRLKIGVAPENVDIKIKNTADYVLSNFTKEEEEIIPKIIEQVKDRIQEYIKLPKSQ